MGQIFNPSPPPPCKWRKKCLQYYLRHSNVWLRLAPLTAFVVYILELDRPITVDLLRKTHRAFSIIVRKTVRKNSYLLYDSWTTASVNPCVPQLGDARNCSATVSVFKQLFLAESREMFNVKFNFVPTVPVFRH